MLSNLTTLRKNRNLSQKELAKIFSVNQNTVSRWESGDRQPDLETLRRLAAFFDVSIGYLTDDTSVSINNVSTKKEPKELKQFLAKEEVTLNGQLMDEEDKEKMIKILEAAFWHAKELNKRK